MTTVALKEQVDGLSLEERRVLLDYLAHTVPVADDEQIDVTDEQVEEWDRRASRLRAGEVMPLTKDELMGRVRASIDSRHS